MVLRKSSFFKRSKPLWNCWGLRFQKSKSDYYPVNLIVFLRMTCLAGPIFLYQCNLVLRCKANFSFTFLNALCHPLLGKQYKRFSISFFSCQISYSNQNLIHSLGDFFVISFLPSSIKFKCSAHKMAISWY